MVLLVILLSVDAVGQEVVGGVEERMGEGEWERGKQNASKG